MSMQFGLYDWSFKTLEWCIENDKECFCYRQLPDNLKIWKNFSDAVHKHKLDKIDTIRLDGKNRPTWFFTPDMVNKYYEQFAEKPHQQYFRNRIL